MSDPAATPVHRENPWTRDQALSLFKIYEDMGWGAKQQMVSIVTWLTPFIFGLIAFSVKSYCDALSSAPTSLATASLASATALALSTFMLVMICGTLRRAENNYKKADEVKNDANANGLLPPTVYKIMSFETTTYLPRFLRLGLRRLGEVYLLFPYSTLILVLGSFVLWRWPQSSAGMFCRPPLTP
jgi:hypothetical protein